MALLRRKEKLNEIPAEEIVSFCEKAFKELKALVDSPPIRLPDDVHFHISLTETNKKEGYRCAFMLTAMCGDSYARIRHRNKYPDMNTSWTLSYLLVQAKTSGISRKVELGCYLYDTKYKEKFKQSLDIYFYAIQQAGLEPFSQELDYEPIEHPVGPQALLETD